MEIADKRELFLLQNNVRHSPFALTSEKLYFIGFEDFIPDKLGRRLKDSMMGLWFPPYRILESIYFEKNGRMLGSTDLRISSTSRLFSFEGFEVEMSAPQASTVFVLKIRATGKNPPRVDVHLKCSVIPVWGYNPEYEWKLLDTGNFPAIEINKGELIYHISNTGDGKISVVGDEVILSTYGSDAVLVKRIINSFEELEKSSEDQVENLSESYSNLSTGDAVLNTAFSWSKTNMKWLYSDFGEGIRGITAGHPEFPSFYSVDTFVALEGMLAAGFFKIAHNSLSTLFAIAEKQKGIMPHEIISTGKVSHQGYLMETAFMPTALWRYYNWTADTSLLKRHFYTAVRGYETLLERGLEGKFTQKGKETEKGINLVTVCYYINGASDLLKINDMIRGRLTNALSTRLADEIEKWTAFLDKEMWIREKKSYAGTYIDGVPVQDEGWKSIIPFEQNLVSNASRYRRFINSSYFGSITTVKGMKGEEAGFDKPVNTGLLIKAALNYDDPDTAWEFYSKNLASFGKYSTACFPEMIDNSVGCFLQAWSGSLIVENMIEGFLGITASKGKLDVLPKLPKVLKFSKIDLKNIRAGDRKYNILFHTNSYIDQGFSIKEV